MSGFDAFMDSLTERESDWREQLQSAQADLAKEAAGRCNPAAVDQCRRRIAEAKTALAELDWVRGTLNWCAR